MAATSTAAASEADALREDWEDPPTVRGWMTTVDHKAIGRRYLVTALVFFFLGGVLALAMRAQLGEPDQRLVDEGTYSQLFTMHGITMIFLFVTPAFAGFGNYLVPLMIGSRDMAFPRLNALSYWVFLLSGVFLWSSVLFGAAPEAGWSGYVPLAEQPYSSGRAVAFYAIGLAFLSIATTAGAVNFVVTICRLRAPGMTLGLMPLFVWAILITSLIMVFALPVLTAGNLMLWVDRGWGGHWFDAAAGGQPLLWQHVFWAFGHPDVYLIFLPATGIISTIIPVFSRRPIVGYALVVISVMTVGLVAFGVWVHHMFATGLPSQSLGFFAAASLVIGIPSGIQVFAWLSTMVTGRVRWTVPMMYATAFIVVFTIGGLTGVMFPAVPADLQVTDTYFVVAHFHYVLVGGAVFPLIAGLVYWFPKATGRLMHERFGVLTFWIVFVGFNLTFFPMHLSGLMGMPRRVATYTSADGWTAWNLLSTVGAAVLAMGLIMGLGNMWWSRRHGLTAGEDPWGADTLEWSTSSPPPAYDFERMPVVSSRHPLWSEERPDPVDVAGRSVLLTSPVMAESERTVAMPGPSWSPLVVACGLASTSYGLLLGWSVVVVIGVLVAGAALLRWRLSEASP